MKERVIRSAQRLTLAIVTVMITAAIAVAQPKSPGPPPPASPNRETPVIEKMESEGIRGAAVSFTGRNFPENPDDITVYLNGKSYGNALRVNIGADNAAIFWFSIPSSVSLGKYSARVDFKLQDKTVVPVIPNGDGLTVYGEAGKAQPTIVSVNPLPTYPENDVFGLEIIGEGFGTRGADNIIFRQGQEPIDICWDDDASCDKNDLTKARGRVIAGRRIVLERIPKEYRGVSALGVRVGTVDSSTVDVVLSKVKKEIPITVALIGFVTVFGLAIFITSRGMRQTAIAGRTHGLVTALLLDKETDTLSLSKLQFYLWTGAAVLGYLYLSLAKSLVQGKPEFADVPDGLPAIILVSAATSVLAQGITSAKGPKGAGEVHPTPADLITVGGVVAPERFQFLIWTFIGVVAFVFLIVQQDPGTIKDLPKVPPGFMELMGVSAAGYLGGKLARKPGPIIDEITEKPGSLVLTIRGRALSRDAGFRIGNDDLHSDNIRTGKPALVEADSQTSEANMAKVLELTVEQPKPEWLAGQALLTIINPDGQRATWPIAATGDNSEGAVDGCDVPVEDPTPDESLPASEGGVE